MEWDEMRWDRHTPNSPACVSDPWSTRRKGILSYQDPETPIRSANLNFASGSIPRGSNHKRTHLLTTEQPSQNFLTLLLTFIPLTALSPLTASMILGRATELAPPNVGEVVPAAGHGMMVLP